MEAFQVSDADLPVFLTLVKENRNTKLKAKKTDDGVYTLACYKSITFKTADVTSWLEFETKLKTALAEHLDAGELKKISVAGEALLERRHGVVCLFGTKSAVDKKIGESAFEGDDCDASALKVTEGAPLEVMIAQCFLGFGDQRRDAHGLERIEAASKHLAASRKDDGDLYMYVLREGVDKFTLPGGKRELCETSLDCARRELLEETGLSLDDATFEETVPLKVYMEIHFYRLQE
jgi:hypothetical protein